MGLRPTILARDWLVTTEHYLSAQAAAAVLGAGGTAADAAVAAILAEGVLNPHMHTFGGEVVALVHAGRGVEALNGHTRAPFGLTLERCRAARLTSLSPDHPYSWSVPAAPAALLALLERFGTWTFADVAAPAIDLARRGFPMHPGLRGPGENLSIAGDREKFLERWPTTAALYLPGGEPPPVGALFTNPALAAVLETMAEAERRGGGSRAAGLARARDAFYRGAPAEAACRFAAEQGSLLGRVDFERYEARFEPAVERAFAGLTVHKCGPWTSGPVLLQTLALLDPAALRAAGHNSPDYLHAVVEALKLAFADREQYYGDPDVVDVPIEALLSDAYASRRRSLIDPRRASLEERPGDPRRLAARLDGPPVPAAPWGPGTTHVNVVDRARTVVSATASGAWIGASPVVPELGFPLTTRCQTFALHPAHPNVVAPGKQPRTTLSPTLVTRDGRPAMALGTMGGDHQDQWTLQAFLNLVLFGMEPQDAVEAPRVSTQHPRNSFHPHEAKLGQIRVEARVAYEVRRALQARGHRIELRPEWAEGYVLAIVVDETRGILRGGADPRGEVAGVIPAYAIGW